MQDNNIIPEIFDIASLVGTLDTMLWIITAGVLLIFAVVSIILYHHWKEYGVEQKNVKRLLIIYFSVSGLLLATMIISLLIWIL
ncbi:MAG: hypothetical protein R3346_02240 [Candidatus Spechtbacterales bacterium]|nr:hypothetical protein [Candidatus Spechtbacterales bacterium]